MIRFVSEIAAPDNATTRVLHRLHTTERQVTTLATQSKPDKQRVRSMKHLLKPCHRLHNENLDRWQRAPCDERDCASLFCPVIRYAENTVNYVVLTTALVLTKPSPAR